MSQLPEFSDSPNLSGLGASSLISRNISVSGRRTSIRLEPEMWQALKDIARRENCSLHVICTLVGRRKRANSTLTAAIRVFIMLYFRAAATEEGHAKAGHGRIGDRAARLNGSAALLNSSIIAPSAQVAA